MSINLRYAIDPEKTKHFGPIFHTIDFDMNEKYTSTYYLQSDGKYKNRKCGTLLIANKKIELSLRDLRYLKNELASLSQLTWRDKPKKVQINTKKLRMEVTRRELYRLEDTLENAIDNIHKSYTMGTMI